MNKRGKVLSDVFIGNIMYLLILLVFVIGLVVFVSSQRDGRALWEDYYVKEIARVLDSAKPGDIIYFDVTKATQIAAKNKKDFDKIFSFDNENNLVSVSLSQTGYGKGFGYFNNIKIEELKIERFSTDIDTNRLFIKIAEKNE